MVFNCFIAILALIGSTAAYSGEYVPKAYYFIDENGRPSDLVPLNPFLRSKRGTFSSASSSSSSSSSSGGRPHYYATQRLGYPSDYGYASIQSGYDDYYDDTPGPVIVGRFGETYGQGQVHGSAHGQRGSFSSSSTSVDSTGKVKYSIQSGKF